MSFIIFYVSMLLLLLFLNFIQFLLVIIILNSFLLKKIYILEEDTQMKFSINPSSSTPSEFNQWKEAIKATSRLPQGLPELFRKDVYLYFLQFLFNFAKPN